MRRVALVAAIVAGVGACGPWLTPIPTYWEYEDAPRVRGQEVPPAPPVVIEPIPEVAEDDYVAPTAPQCTAIYVVTSKKSLYAFHPKDASFEPRGTLACPNAGWATPFSMAVARTGIAHVLYNDGHLYRVRLADAHCEETNFEPNQSPGFTLFGMGYARREGKDALYVAHIPISGRSLGLARIDTDTYRLHYIGPFSENPGGNIELTPTGRGPLHGYFLNFGAGGTLVSIDTETATIDQATPLAVGTESSALAVSWWGGAFYIFTTVPARGTRVSRYDEKRATAEEVGGISEIVVGAGVSTCAPQTMAMSE
jgi:hypothetical protein